MIPEALNFHVLAPIGFVGIGSMVVLLLEVFLSRAQTFMGRNLDERLIGSLLAGVSIFFLFLALSVACQAFSAGGAAVFNPQHPLIRLDAFSALATALIAGGALLSCALAIYYLEELHINRGEYYALLLLATAGMMTLVAAVDFLAIFLGLELMSIPIYALAGFDRRKLRSNESAMKYFLIGSFASAVLLYGVALLYGTTGSTSLLVLRSGFDPSSPLAVIGIALVLVGFAFKISAVPFHQWTPDVYEGAPSSVTAFMSVTVKTAAVAALLRVLGLGLGPLEEMLVNVLWVLAVLTMVVGNLMAVIQDNVKRLLAYSSIGHAGYILVGIVAGGVEGWSAVVFYLIAYLFMNLGAFGVVVALANRGEDCERVDSFAGLARTRPGLAALMTLFMVALTGIPPTVGFFAKFGIFLAAVNAGFVGLAIIGVLMSAVSVYYYLRIPVLMYMREPEEQAPRLETSSGEIFVLGLCAIAVLFLGIFPNGGELPVVDWARTSVSVLFD
ncbi:MAG: NADH-quinone oxidoreductase subunit N [Myxococcota bacterium]|nr:NADH-quinone oxidoreductase subunit N [Deltaproteobacteria bacterium]MCP4243562.1 NADH-quinone oxidoreductase subunit N [bacterium]MDP6073503.1 NADH-quinone oxidoreductase subunit N [Myxococcota bacterium]MDP6242851.1 NADH-quinone oxidoreductase subunit N [Myxococcota bacterium]MDP7076136.1 NADH-quinone oxidoreductase subunit N [Myxococcota bacterium]